MRLRRKSRQKLLVTAALALVVLLWWQGGSGNRDTHDQSYDTAELKVILVYPPSASHLVGSMETCRINHCKIAQDMALYNDSDAFVVSGRYIKDVEQLPVDFPPNQLRFFHVMDPPDGNDTGIYISDGNFNGVISYVTTSQVYLPFGLVEPIPEANPGSSGINYAEGKSGLVAWMPDNCESESQRETYVRDLMNHVGVDIYGKCGKPVCSAEQNAEQCDAKQQLGKNYKFYLSFESKICKNYYTGEVWDALRNNMVPIVLAQDDTPDVLPQGSYIDIRDFESPDLLAEYLQIADKNETLYNEYHSWRTSYRVREPVPWQCQVCRILHMEPDKFRKVVSVDDVWTESDCTPSDEYFIGFENTTIKVQS